MVELSVSKKLREYVEKLIKRGMERWGREIYPVRATTDLLVGSVCRVVETGIDHVVMDCGEYKISLDADIGLGEPEIIVYIYKQDAKNG